MYDYKDVTELNHDELYELKDKLYWECVWGDESEYMTDEQRAIVDSADYSDDIPDSLIFDVFGGTCFVEEDFWCNVTNR